jgi:hypothetical protein
MARAFSVRKTRDEGVGGAEGPAEAGHKALIAGFTILMNQGRADALVRGSAPWPVQQRDQGVARGSGDPPYR